MKISGLLWHHVQTKLSPLTKIRCSIYTHLLQSFSSGLLGIPCCCLLWWLDCDKQWKSITAWMIKFWLLWKSSAREFDSSKVLDTLGMCTRVNYSQEPCSQRHRYFNTFKTLMMFIVSLMWEWNYAHPYTARCVYANIPHTARAIPGLGLTLTLLNSVICKAGMVKHWSEKQQCSQANHLYIASEICLGMVSAKNTA